MTQIRIIADVILVISVFLWPWWVSSILCIAAIFYFRDFYEALIFGLFMDSVYSLPEYAWGFLFTLSAALVFIVSFSLKKRLKFYDSW